MGSWVHANTLVHHKAQLLPGKSSESVRNDPNTVTSMYCVPPSEEVTILEFEAVAVARLRVLKGLEVLKSQGRKDEDLKTGIKQLLDKHMKAKAGHAATELHDAVSHFALRLAYCMSEDNRRWFLAQEVDLFRHRFACLCGPEKGAFLAACNLPYEVVGDAELRDHRDGLAQAAVHTGVGKHQKAASVSLAALADLEIRRIPFEQVPDLIAARRVYVSGGDAYVPNELLGSVLASTFQDRLSKALVLAAGRWALTVAEQEADRLTPVIRSLAERNVTLDSSANAQGLEGKISLANVPVLAQRHFPLCMQHLYSTLQSERHLRHAGRMQLGLFLKRAGLTLDESLLFWKQSFAPKTSAEKFEKEYAYNVRHGYGREGRRKDYEAQSCLKVIAASPGVGEAHGCPFKTLGQPALRAAMSRAGVKSDLAAQAADKAQAGHYQVACARVFEGTFGEAPDAGVTHPNSYLVEAMDVMERRSTAQGQAKHPEPSPTLSAATSGHAATPSVASSTPLQLPFIRTPMAVGSTHAVTPQARVGPPATSPLLQAGESAAPDGAGITPLIAPILDSPIRGVQEKH